VIAFDARLVLLDLDDRLARASNADLQAFAQASW